MAKQEEMLGVKFDNNKLEPSIDSDHSMYYIPFYKTDEYFDIYEYDPREYKEFMIQSMSRNLPKEIAEKIFLNTYASPVYGMFDEEKLASRKIYKHKKRY